VAVCTAVARPLHGPMIAHLSRRNIHLNRIAE
jgi:hypothetical protein